MKLIITDKADPSVGLFESLYAIDCPFDKDADEDIKEFFKRSMIRLYNEYCEGRVYGYYSNELTFNPNED